MSETGYCSLACRNPATGFPPEIETHREQNRGPRLRVQKRACVSVRCSGQRSIGNEEVY